MSVSAETKPNPKLRHAGRRIAQIEAAMSALRAAKYRIAAGEPGASRAHLQGAMSATHDLMVDLNEEIPA